MGFDVKCQEQKLNLVGTQPQRPDGVDKVTGRALWRLFQHAVATGGAHSVQLSRPCAHRKHRHIAPEALKRVKAVVTAADQGKRV